MRPIATRPATSDGQAPRSTTRQGSRRTGRAGSGTSRLAAIGAAALCGVTGLYLAENANDAALVKAANEAGVSGHYARALTKAREVSRPPADADALVLQAYALQSLGRLREASVAFSRAARRNPNDWKIHFDWALALAQLGDRNRARREMGGALELNPRMILPPGFERRVASGA